MSRVPRFRIQNSFTTKISLYVFLILVSSCQKPEEAKRKEQHVRDLIEYVKSQPIDSAVFTRQFLSERLRAKKSSYGFYIDGLQEMKMHLHRNDPVRIEVDKKNDDIYFFSTLDSTRLFFHVKPDGIDSFIPFFKGGEIVSWM